MKFQNIIFLTLVSVSLFMTSCKNGNSIAEDAIISIPANASSVTGINIKRLMDKADFDAVQKMAFYQDFVNDASQGNPGIAAVLKDPNTSGVNLDANVYMVQDIDIMNPEKAFVGVIASLKSKDDFKKLVTSEGNPEIKTGEGFEYFQAGRNAIVSWNDEIAVMGTSQGFGADLLGGVSNIYNTTKETSIVGNADLQKCFSKKADVVSWFCSNTAAEAAKGKMGMASFIISQDMLTDNYAHSYFNFEKGAIVSESNYDLNEKLADEFRHIFKDEVKTDFSKLIPSENLIFAATGALDMKGVKMILEKKSMTGMADMSLKEYGLSVEDIAKTIDGDFLVTGHKGSNPYTPKVLTAVKINDMEGFQKIIDLGKDYDMIEDGGNGIYNIGGLMGMGGSDIPQIYVTDGMVYFGNQSSTIPALQSGDYAKNGLVGKEIRNIFSDNIMGAFVDFRGIEDYLDGLGLELKMLKDARMEMNRDNGVMRLEMTDQKTNALKSLFEWANDNYEKKGAM